MYNIALICEHGASTGMIVRKMQEYAKSNSIEANIQAFADSQLPNLVNEKDIILLGPQVGYKLDRFKKEFPDFANRMTVINSMDFGMMDGAKVLKEAISTIDSLK